MPKETPISIRFWSKVDKNGPIVKPELGPCWLWLGRLYDGYGHIWFRGKQLIVHRVAYEIGRGAIPVGLEIDHLCRTRNCVNWNHMEAVTTQVNVLRGISMCAINAAKTHCKRGHIFDKENTYEYKGIRICRTCNRERAKLFEREKRARARIAREAIRQINADGGIHSGEFDRSLGSSKDHGPERNCSKRVSL